MNSKLTAIRAAESAASRFVLDRRTAVPELVGRHEDFLIISGLAGAVYDMTALTNQGDHFYGLGGAMGAACMMGLGLALARPDKRVLVVTGDGELLMSLGSLCSIGVINPPNLSIVCVDNGHYGETGFQKTHTYRGVDIEKFAQGAGIKMTCTVSKQEEIPNASRMLREGNGTAFVLLTVAPTEAPKVKLNLDGAVCRVQFRKTQLPHA
ncbi:MAG: thiamine pyrophosphate-binding protein [Aquamicrobium sp.]|nr:thiamine pyrophosphate-binding protein [Aquamicrobium sp.]